MSLMDELKATKVLQEETTVAGKKFLVEGKSLAMKARVYAAARNAEGVLDQAKVDAGFLSLCVLHPETQKRIGSPEDWLAVPSHITGPLIAVVARVMGLTTEGTVDPNDLESIQN